MWAVGAPGAACATDGPVRRRSLGAVGPREVAAALQVGAEVAAGPAVGAVASVAVVVEAVAAAEAEVDTVAWEAAPVAFVAEAAAAGPRAVGAATDPLLVLGKTRSNEAVGVVSRLATPLTS